jgi:hypothetical protein
VSTPKTRPVSKGPRWELNRSGKGGGEASTRWHLVGCHYVVQDGECLFTREEAGAGTKTGMLVGGGRVIWLYVAGVKLCDELGC